MTLTRLQRHAALALAVVPAWVCASGLPERADSPAIAGVTASATGRPLSLADAIAGALAKNERIRVERAALDSARAAVSGARGAYDPRFVLSGGWRSLRQPANSSFSGAPDGALAPTERSFEAGASIGALLPTGAAVTVTAGSSRQTSDSSFALLSPAYQAELGVELRQPLLRDRVIDPARLTVRVAAADRDRAAASLQRELADTVAAVEMAYWNLVAARRAVAVQEDAVALAARQLEETRIRIASGSTPENEVAQPRAELERRRGDLLAAREAAARAETALKREILGDGDEGWADSLEPADDIAVEAEPVDASEAMARALAARPELDAAAAAVERSRTEAAFAQDRVRPALDLVLGYDRRGLAGARNPSLPELARLEGDLGDAAGQLGRDAFHDARVALELQVVLGNRTARAAAEVARNTELQAEAELGRVRKAIRVEVLDAAAAAETAAARIEAARAAREAAEVQLAGEAERFKAGLSTNFLVLTRQNDLAAARLAEIEALTDYRTARTELARATGSLLEQRGIALQ